MRACWPSNINPFAAFDWLGLHSLSDLLCAASLRRDALGKRAFWKQMLSQYQCKLVDHFEPVWTCVTKRPDWTSRFNDVTRGSTISPSALRWYQMHKRDGCDCITFRETPFAVEWYTVLRNAKQLKQVTTLTAATTKISAYTRQPLICESNMH